MPINAFSISSNGTGVAQWRQSNPGVIAIWAQVDGMTSPAETKAYLISTSANVAAAQKIVRAVPKTGGKVQVLLLIDQFLADTEEVTFEVAVWQRGGTFGAEPGECESPK